jgi:glutathione S-transferase
VLLDEQPVRTGWAEILDVAEHLAPSTPLLPADPRERVHVMGLCHEIMGEGALLWSARLLSIDAGLETEGREGFPSRVAQYLAPRYGWTEEGAPAARARARTRAVEALALLDGELASARARERGRGEGPFYAGATMTALDLYSAAALNALVPLPDTDCPMAPAFRAAFAFMGTTLGDAITPALLAHRDHVVKQAFELPIAL